MTCWLCGFETNELVTNENAPICKNGPCQICIAVANVDDEVSQAVANLRRLLMKRCDLRSVQNRAHDPIHRLPVEITAYIFELVVPTRNEWGKIVRVGRAVMAPYLTSICRGWRDMALSNPLLWSTIRIVLGPYPSSDPSARISFLNNWIARSQTSPLTLHLTVDNGNNFEKELKAVLDAISHSSTRWHSLSLVVPYHTLRVFRRSDLQLHRLNRLRIISSPGLRTAVTQPFPLLNPIVSPDKIEIRGVSFQSLQISWDHLTSAKVQGFGLGEVIQLFQHALQMTYCHISEPHCRTQSLALPSIVHKKLNTLSLCYAREDVAAMLLGFLTLPCLQELHTSETVLLHRAYFPALLHRSACSLTRIRLLEGAISKLETVHDLQPFLGVTDIVLETAENHVALQKLLLDGYFPDLRHLTIRLQSFIILWHEGLIPRLIVRDRARPDGPNEGTLYKILIVDDCQPDSLSMLWDSDIGTLLKTLQSTRLRKNGFEILLSGTPPSCDTVTT